MNLRNLGFARWTLLSLACLSLSGCGLFRTVEHRSLQDEFSAAVRADNNPNHAAFTYENPYQPVLDRLTDEKLRDLAPKLLPNAYMMRAVAAWRTGDLALARSSASAGLNPELEHPAAQGTREDVLLHLLPALVYDSEATRAWIAAGRALTHDGYFGAGQQSEAGVDDSFAAAFESLQDAIGRFDDEVTPEGVRDYCNYQAWRILLNWEEVLTTLEPRETRRAATAVAAEVTGADPDSDDGLLGVASTFGNAIPRQSPLGKLVRLTER